MSRIEIPAVLLKRLSDTLQALLHHLNIGFANARIQGDALNKSEHWPSTNAARQQQFNLTFVIALYSIHDQVDTQGFPPI